MSAGRAAREHSDHSQHSEQSQHSEPCDSRKPRGVQTVAVVIDVFRAFTVAATAFDGGADAIVCVKDLERARRLKADRQGSLLVGEDGGLRPDGFDVGNSPVAIASLDLTGVTVIQRTSNGTRGLVSATTDHVVAAAAVNATATANYIASIGHPTHVRYVPTRPGKEDQACAEFIAAVLAGEPADRSQLAATLDNLAAAAAAEWSERLGHDHPEVRAYAADLELCCKVDRFNHALVGTRTADGIQLRRATA